MDASSSRQPSPAFTVPGVGELMVPVEPLRSNTPVAEILELFRKQTEMLILPVVEESMGHYLGALSRRSFLSFMTQAFVQELFSRKPLFKLLETHPELAHSPMIVHPQSRVDQTLRELVAKQPGMLHDALPVLEGNRILGIVSIADMMLRLSESQERLIEVMQTLSRRLQEEVSHAAFLQRNLLPPPDFDLPGVKGVATLLTSTEVGGDFYDYYCVDQRWIVVLIGDVSGHGVASGTLVSGARAAASLLSAEGERNPQAILSRLNATILKLANQRLLMTLFAACLDAQTGDLTYANAGHQFPYLYRWMFGSMETLEAGGLPLGKSAVADYSIHGTQLDVGDRLFFCTDGILEEESDAGEPFGYERLEHSLAVNFHETPALLRDRVLESLVQHSGKSGFADDVTLLCLEYDERQMAASHTASSEREDNLGLVRIAESFYRANTTPLIPRISRQNLVFLAEGPYADLIPRLSADGLRRVLPRHQGIIHRLGWRKLLSQHCDPQRSDLSVFLPEPEHLRQFQLAHSREKEAVITEVQTWAESAEWMDPDRLDVLLLLIDEALENGLYAAPRNGRGQALHIKGSERMLGEGERLSLSIAVQGRLLAVHVVDVWGTLTPAVFLNRLARHSRGDGLIPGVGGAGLFLIWRLCDYLQIRVHPHHQTQVCMFFDLASPFDSEADKGFQFIYHSEIHENLCHESLYLTDRTRAAD